MERAARAGPQVDVSKPSSYRRRILEADVLELPRGGSEGGQCSMLALHLRGTAFLWHQVSLCAVRLKTTLTLIYDFSNSSRYCSAV